MRSSERIFYTLFEKGENTMYNTLKRLYLDGRLTDAQLNNAVSKGWITAAQAEAIREAAAALL
jgi:hypothetical protein